MSWAVVTVCLVPFILGCYVGSDRINETRAYKERIYYLSVIFEKYANNDEISLENVKKLMVNLGLPPATDELTVTKEGEGTENDTHCHDVGAGCEKVSTVPDSSGKTLTKRSLSSDHGHYNHNKVWFTSVKIK
jgi:hypothetical protein